MLLRIPRINDALTRKPQQRMGQNSTSSPDEEDSYNQDIRHEEQVKYDDEGRVIQDDSVDFIWEVGDVEADFKALEQAIIRDNAEENLRHAERVEILDAHAAQRRPLLPDMYRFISATVIWALLFVALKKMVLLRSSSRFAHLFARRFMTLPWDIHFWVVVVAAPILFLQVKRATMPKPPPIPPELQNLPPELLKFSTVTKDLVDPETSCNDYVLCLAEQWVSAVKGAAGFAGFVLVCAAALRIPFRPVEVPIFNSFVTGTLQFFTRLGAMLSLFQYPKLLFELQRSQQPQPAQADVAVLQNLVRSLFRWGLPVGLASDLSRILMVLGRKGMIIFCVMFLTFLSAMELRYKQSRQPGTPGRLQRALDNTLTVAVKACRFLVTTGVPCALMIACSTYIVTNLWKPKNFVPPSISWLSLFANGALLLALIRPIWHLVAFGRIVDIVYVHDMSLAAEVMQQTLNNPEERAKRYKWRSRLRWRDPERIHVVFGRAWRNYQRWFFFSGSVQDKVRIEEEAKRQKETKEEIQPYKIWEKIKREMEHEPPETPKPDRNLWKQHAMETAAKFHETDYASGFPLVDPLGVALHQRLGIGLFFPKDHTRKLEENENPSTERLQTRAVKSAIEQVNQIWKGVKISKGKILTEVKDPQEQKIQLKELDKKKDKELNYLATRITELIPTKASNGTIDMKFMGFTRPIMVGGQKVMVTTDRADGTSIAANDIFKRYEAKALNSTKCSGASESEGGYYDYGADKDDFMEAWLKQRFASGSSKENEDNDGESSDDSDDQQTILV